MADIVNLRLHRKAKARADAAEEAARHRAAHGRSKTERAAAVETLQRGARFLDGHARPGAEGRDGGDA